MSHSRRDINDCGRERTCTPTPLRELGPKPSASAISPPARMSDLATVPQCISGLVPGAKRVYDIPYTIRLTFNKLCGSMKAYMSTPISGSSTERQHLNHTGFWLTLFVVASGAVAYFYFGHDSHYAHVAAVADGMDAQNAKNLDDLNRMFPAK